MQFKDYPEDYLTKKGWAYIHRGKELVVRACPYCADMGKTAATGHFYVSAENGCFHCKKCGESGGFRKLMSDQGDFIEPKSTQAVPKKSISISKLDELRKAFRESDRAKEFFRGRGLIVDGDESTVNFFRIGYHAKSDSLTFPYFLDCALAGIKYRKIGEKTFAKEKGYESTTYNIDCVDLLRPIIVVEGELDCMAAWQMGFKNVISLSDGAQST